MSIYIEDRVCDYGLSVFGEVDALYICSSQPHSYNDAVSTYALGGKKLSPGALFSAPMPGTPEGRTVASVPILDTAVTAAGTATRWAAVDTVNSRLIASGTLATAIDIHPGQWFSLSSMTITMVGTLATIALTHLPVAVAVSAGAPLLGSPVFSYAQKDLIAVGLGVGSFIMPAPTFRLSKILNGASLTAGLPSVGSPQIKPVYNLVAASFDDAAPPFVSPQFKQSHSLNGASLSSGVLTVSSPVFYQRGPLTATSVVSGTPTVGSPVLRPRRQLAASPLSVAVPTVGAPVLQHIIPFNVILPAASFTSIKPVLPSIPIVTQNP